MERNMPQDEFARRRMLRQKQLRKRRRFVFFIFFMVVMLAVGVALCFTVFFPVEKVVVSGSKIYTPQQIADACGLSTKDNLFAFSGDKLQETLRLKLPYVETVKIKRELPGTVRITVTDAKAAACYLIDAHYYTVSESGFVLSDSEEIPQNVFEIRAKDVKCTVGREVKYGNPATGEMIEQFVTLIEEKKIKTDYIDVTDILSLSAKVEGRFEVDFGTSNYLDRKIAHLAGMIQGISPEATGKINLSMWAPDKTQGVFEAD